MSELADRIVKNALGICTFDLNNKKLVTGFQVYSGIGSSIYVEVNSRGWIKISGQISFNGERQNLGAVGILLIPMLEVQIKVYKGTEYDTSVLQELLDFLLEANGDNED